MLNRHKPKQLLLPRRFRASNGVESGNDLGCSGSCKHQLQAPIEDSRSAEYSGIFWSVRR